MAVGAVVGGSVACDGEGCRVTLALDRADTLAGSSYIEGGSKQLRISVSFAVGGDGLEKALRDAAGGGRVVILGEVDGDGSGNLMGWAETFGTFVPTSNAGQARPVFGSCGPPPWTAKALSSCEADAPKVVPVHVEGSLVSVPYRPESGHHAILALHNLVITSSSKDSVAFAVPGSMDFALIPATSTLAKATRARPNVRSLKAGDHVMFDGVYRRPAECRNDRCMPTLVASSKITLRR